MKHSAIKTLALFATLAVSTAANAANYDYTEHYDYIRKPQLSDAQTDSQIQASASQDPWAMAQTAVGVGYGIMNGQKPANPMIQMSPQLVTRDNVNSYKGWSSAR